MISRRGFLGGLGAVLAFTGTVFRKKEPIRKELATEFYRYRVTAVLEDGSEVRFSTTQPMQAGKKLSLHGLSFTNRPDGIIGKVMMVKS